MEKRSLSFYGVFFLLFAGALNFRLRLLGDSIHIGGAEFALAPYDLVLFVLFPYLISKYWDGKFRKTSDFINVSAFLFICLSSFSIFNSVRPEFTVYEIARHFKVFILFLLLRRSFRSTNSWEALIPAAMILIFAEFFVSLGQLGAGEAEVTEDAAEVKEVFVEGGLVRVSGTLRHPNLLGLFVNMLLPFCVMGAIHFKGKFIYVASIAVAFGMLVLTYSRTQIALYVFVLVAIFFTFQSSRGKMLFKNRAAWYALAPLLVVFLIAVLINFESLYERFFNAPESNTETRFVLAAIALEMIIDKPILGIGWNTFIYSMSGYDLYKAAAAFQYPVHNMYLLIASETGGLGFISFLVLLFSIAKAYFFAKKNLKTIEERNLLQSAFVVLSLVLVTGMQGWSFRADSIQLIIWICYAVVAAMYDRARISRSAAIKQR